MADLFWQRSLASFDYAGLVAFIEEGYDEGDHLEYKLPKHDRDSDRLVFDDKFLETVVAYANSSDGLIVVGVHDDAQKRLAEIPGIRRAKRDGKPMGDPASILRNVCATRVTPQVYLETHLIEIPEGEPHAGNVVLVARVRRGGLTPYALDDWRIFIRNGDRDDPAKVRQIEALFARREQAVAATDTGWQKVSRFIFDAMTIQSNNVAPIAMVCLTPVFPLPDGGIEVLDDADAQFSKICAAFGFPETNVVIREPDGVIYLPPRSPNGLPNGDQRAAYAYGDGSVGVRVSVSGRPQRPEGLERNHLRLDRAWRTLRELLDVAQRWPRVVCGYDGPLLCAVAFGGLTDILGKEPPSEDFTARYGDLVGSYRPNHMPSWTATTEWDAGTATDDLLDYFVSRLSRQLQFPFYAQYRDRIRETSYGDK